MSEANFSYTGKDSKGNLCTVRGDSYDEFYGNLTALLSGDTEAVDAFLTDEFARSLAPTPAQAFATVTQAFPQAQSAQPAAQQAVPVQAPTGAHQCAHGDRVFKSSDTARGKWNRWECAIPWTKGADNSIRCKAINS